MKIFKNSSKLQLLYAVLLFVVVSVPFMFINDLMPLFQKYVEVGNWVAQIIYVLLLIISIVVAPVTMPLFLVSGAIFGVQAAAVYNIIGWSIGAMIAFLIARYFNKSILSRFILLKKLKKYEQRIPQNMEFMSIILLRMVLPVDILSYALGLFSNISFIRYMLATIIGVTPFSIIFAYGSDALINGKYVVFIAIILLVFLSFFVGIRYIKRQPNC